jgi:bacillithiol system protein YtxJ
MNWIQLTDSKQLNDIIKHSNSSSIRAVLVFKHSTRCSISSMALNRVESKWKDDETIPVYFLDLIQFRHISNEIAQSYNVEHQSPQVLLIKNGTCIYNESHSSIRVDSILEKIASSN